MNPVTILIGGDLGPTESNYSSFADGNIKELIDPELLDLLSSVDHKIFNLEVPLTDIKTPINKAGPNLIAPTSTINGLKLLNPALFGLANNHILDQGGDGLIQTMELLESNQMSYLGAGKDLADASRHYIIEKYNKKIGIYACAENEFSIAGKDKAGANPFDPLESFDHIMHLKSKCDYVLVLFHGGKEHYRYPSPYLQKACRKMAEKGADVIICQHSHCIGAHEKYLNSVIIYGQGNFLFDRRSNEFWNTSLLIKASFGSKMTIDFVPIYKRGNGVGLARNNIGEEILSPFYERSKQISFPGFIESEYDKFCLKNGPYYLSTLAGFGRILRKIDKLLNGKISKQFYSSKKFNLIQNHIECEAHRELLLRYLHLIRMKKRD